MNFLRRAASVLIVLGFAILPAMAAPAAHGKAPGADEAIVLAQIVLLILAGRLLGELMLKLRQPAVIGQLLAGVLLGPSVFGALWPEAHDLIFPADPTQRAMIAAVAQLGILLLLLLTGMETDLKLVRRTSTASIAVSVTGIAIPFACGFALGQFLPPSLLAPDQKLAGSLFIGTALSISSVKIVATVIREMNFMRRDLGQIIVASAIIEDSIGWVVIAITFGIAQNGKLDALSLVRTIGGVLVFLAASFTIGQFAVFRIIRWVNDTFESEFAVVTAILVIMGVMALATYLLGVQTVLGAFVAGILVGESPILTEHIRKQLRGLVAALFMPVFFGQAGISADLSLLRQPQLLIITGAIVLIASFGKFGGAFLGGSLGGLSRKESLAIGCAMNARGSTEVIVASIGLSMAILTQSLFTMIVTMAVVTTMIMPPMLRSALARLPMKAEEKERLEREALDARGFIAKLERLLLAVDESANGRMAAQLAGFIAGARGMPMTVLRLGRSRKSTPKADDEEHRRAIEASARESASATAEVESEQPRRAEITAPSEKSSVAMSDIAEFSRKGFGLFFVGMGHARSPDGAFGKRLTDVVNGFQGSLAILIPPTSEEPATPRNVLIPVSGTDVSLDGAEVAFVLARATGATARAVYVSPRSARGAAGATVRRSEEAVLKQITLLAARHGVEVATQIAKHELTDAPILKEGQSREDLIVMGVSRRPGDVLFFGNTAAALMKKWKGSILLVAR